MKSTVFVFAAMALAGLSPMVGQDAGLAESSFSAAPQLSRPWDKVKEVAIGSAASDWRLKTAKGGVVTLSEQQGNVVVLDFWANWCGPCRKLEPVLDQLVSEYQSKPVKFYTVSVWPDRDFSPQAYLKEHKMASTFLMGDDAVAREYGIWGLPTYFVISPTGKIAYIHVLLSVEPEPLAKRLHDAIERALPKEKSAQSPAQERGITK
jgi:thiol-disulfide isomerase/thioredoxin